MDGGGIIKLRPYLRSYWQLMAMERGRVSFIQGGDGREVTHAPLDDPTHMLLQIALSELWALKKNTWSWEGKLEERKSGNVFDQNTFYASMKFSTIDT